MDSYLSIRAALRNIWQQQLDERFQALKEEQANIRSKRLKALADLNEQVSLLETMRDTQDETEESLDFFYFWEEKLITDFNNVPDSKRTKQILRDYYTELNLFDIHIGLQTVILEDNNNRVNRQERVGINSNQRYNALVSQTIQIPWQLHVLQNGILSQ